MGRWQAQRGYNRVVLLRRQEPRVPSAVFNNSGLLPAQEHGQGATRRADRRGPLGSRAGPDRRFERAKTTLSRCCLCRTGRAVACAIRGGSGSLRHVLHVRPPPPTADHDPLGEGGRATGLVDARRAEPGPSDRCV